MEILYFGEKEEIYTNWIAWNSDMKQKWKGL